MFHVEHLLILKFLLECFKTKMKKLIDCYAKREGIHSPNDVCFFIKKTTDEHERPVLCEEQMTPSSLLLQEGDKIWCSADRKGMP